ncbi:MAG: beta-galactosidase [Tepidisphaeraceae bacterium]
MIVWLDDTAGENTVSVNSVTAEGDGVPAPVPFFPFIDKYGQYKHTDWPDKIYTDEDFKADLAKEKDEAARHPGPTNWDRYGGWKDGPKQQATGHFYTKKIDGKWWLVDPDGNLFWSYGPTGVGFGGDRSPVTDKEKWFEQLPAKDGPFAKYWADGKGAGARYYKDGKAWTSFSFASANIERKYGPNWREETADFLHQRLRNWGLNTMANWSDAAVYLKHKTPYTVTLGTGSGNGFPDVFSSEFAKSLNAQMDKQAGTTAGDPFNIGYFVDNELGWGSKPDGEAVVLELFKAAPTSASKQAMIKALEDKYLQPAELNAVWGTDYTTWDQMLESRDALQAKNTQAASVDLQHFGNKLVEKYFSTVRAAVKRGAPNNLYLGCRFHGSIHMSVLETAAKYVDVVSYNYYDVPTPLIRRYAKKIDKPFIISEFSVGSDIGRTPFRGSRLTMLPKARLDFLEKSLKDGFENANVVGMHYFQFRDQPLSARPDGEGTLRGFVNVADTPHFDLVQQSQRLASTMYEVRMNGKAE